MPPQRHPADSSAWVVVPDAWGRPRVGAGRDGSSSPASSTDDPSTPPPSPAYAPATSVLPPPGPPAADSHAPSRSCTGYERSEEVVSEGPCGGGHVSLASAGVLCSTPGTGFGAR